MTLLASAPAWLAIILAILLVVAAVEDMWRLTIANWLSGAIIVAAIVAVAIEGPTAGVWQNLLLFAGILALGTMLFARGIMGGGDIKLLAASALWFDLSQGWRMLVAVALAGGLMTIATMLLRLLPWPDRLRARAALLRRRASIPYAVAIAAGVGTFGWWIR